MSKPDGGPAFPIPQRDGEDWKEGHPDGMTLRDHFAGQALAGLCARMGWLRYLRFVLGHFWGANEARIAFSIARAMLAERAKIDAMLREREATP